jgi:voltage-gated sodium channel
MLRRQWDLQTRSEAEVVQHISSVQGLVNQVNEILSYVQGTQQEQTKSLMNIDKHEDEIMAMQKKEFEIEKEHWKQHDKDAEEQKKHILGMEEVVFRIDNQLEHLLRVQQKLSAELEEENEHLVKIEKENTKLKETIRDSCGEGLVPILESCWSKFAHDQSVNVDFTDLIKHVQGTQEAVEKDVGVVLGEIGRIQKAMHMDFVVDTKKYGDRRGLRVREFAIQTDSSAAAEIEKSVQTDAAITVNTLVQTDESGHAHKHHKKGRGTANKTSVQHQSIRRLTQQHQGALETGKKKQLFADAEAMKQKARDALMKPPFNVYDYYHRQGCSQQVARNPAFENTTFFIIFLNALWIAVDIDNNDATLITEADPLFAIMEYAFCTYFSFEIIVRFLAFRRKKDCLKDWWFIFDAVLVMMMVSETFILTIVLTILDADSQSIGFLGNLSVLRLVRLVKLIRMARLARLLRAVPELVILLKGILAASRSVIMVFFLWSVIIYFYAMIFRQLTKGEDIGHEYFESVPASMNTLLLYGILPEIAQIVNNLGDANPLLWPLMMSFILLASLTVANMLIGVLVGVVGAVASAEKEGMVVSHLAAEMRTVYALDGRSMNEPLLKEDFQKLLVTPHCACAAKEVGVDVIGMLDIADMVYDDIPADEGLSFEALVSLILSMRGTNPATVKDIKEQVKVFKAIVNESVEGMATKFDRVLEGLQTVDSKVREIRALQDDEESDGSNCSNVSKISRMSSFQDVDMLGSTPKAPKERMSLSQKQLLPPPSRANARKNSDAQNVSAPY